MSFLTLATCIGCHNWMQRDLGIRPVAALGGILWVASKVFCKIQAEHDCVLWNICRYFLVLLPLPSGIEEVVGKGIKVFPESFHQSFKSALFLHLAQACQSQFSRFPTGTMIPACCTDQGLPTEAGSDAGAFLCRKNNTSCPGMP